MFRVSVLLATSALFNACSTYQSSPSAPTPSATPPTSAPAPSPGGSPTVTITAAGLSPREITIAVGQRVTFVNNDTRNHDLVGGIDPAHPDCPEIVVGGFLTPGQRSQTGAFMTARTCEYHDHTALGVPAFQGRIIVQ